MHFDKVTDFSNKNGLKDHLEIAVSTVKKCFSKFQSLEIVYENDPETNEDWLCLETTIEGDIEQVLEEYQNYTKEVNSLIPWPAIGLIRFSYNIVKTEEVE
jgi:hypothetical protein